MIEDKNLLSEFAYKFCSIIEKHTKYAVVSGFFVISSGRSRGTEDIDIIIEKMTPQKFKALHEELIKNNFSCLQSNNYIEIYEYLKDNLSVRYILNNNLIPNMELKFSKDLLDEYQLETRKKEKNTGTDIFFSSIECNLAFKEELLKSKKDLEDAKFLRIIYEKK